MMTLNQEPSTALTIRHASRSEDIRRFCGERKIDSLVHFTPAANLISIFEQGLLSRHALERGEAWQPHLNDRQRKDGYKDAICLSIGFPNYPMFYRYRRRSPEQWAVLVLDAAVLWELDCAFYPENAAASDAFDIPLDERKQPTMLHRMFDDMLGIHRAQHRLPEQYPTHPQAEVLVFERISLPYIRQVHFCDPAAYYRWMTLEVRCWLAGNEEARLPQIGCDARFFRPRHDSALWPSGRTGR